MKPRTPGSAEDSSIRSSGNRRRRIVACLRACEGIPTVTLERGILLRLIGACIHVREPRIREILDELTNDWIGSRVGRVSSGRVEGPG